ncbi:MAG: NfeD family protein [Clostridia bacterium]|nr:NfeD family protein [Clostridia bacterium]
MNSLAIMWLILAVVLGVIEAFTPALVCIWFAVSALAAALISALGLGVWWQIGIFILLSVILLIITRPLARKFVASKTVATNADRIIGAEGVVILPLDPIENNGQVKVMGQIWSAKSLSGERIEKDAAVVVKGLEGVKVVVERIR